VFFKCENLQRMGAFKFRGAFNALSCFDAAAAQGGVVAFSSGNHAQAIALSARLLGMPATIIMPQDAPAAKVAATGLRRRSGAVRPLHRGPRGDGRRRPTKRGMTLIPPYDHPRRHRRPGHGGQGADRGNRPLDALFVCLGGGGLLGGTALAARALSPE
jgi:threonine dehydratase